ncbi:hypothetical protein SASPL_102342 [Salvia splendens]|uniref:Uncharacterized protein n=1 Tax=Salvia splendens TaxID=180675 RepID=A0A8X8YTI6_SALSN|nr:hypothetical protein SASPL_102342 [Salvia splendens]
MGICLSNQIKAESHFSTGTGATSSKMISGDGTELSNSSSKRSSASVPPSPRSEGEILQSSNMKSFAFSDLKAATRNFRLDSVLGEGGFGSVFKGWIDEHSLEASKPGSSMVVAVKRLNQEGWQGHKEWLNRPTGEHNLVEWAKPYLTNKRRMFRLIDSRIEGQYTVDLAVKAATLAYQCISMDPRARPDMNEVITALEQLHDSRDAYKDKDHALNRKRQSNSNTEPKSCKTTAGGGRPASAYPRPALYT